MALKARRALGWAAALLALAAAIDGALVARAYLANRAIASAELSRLEGEAPAELVFARAFVLGGRGDSRAALAHYRQAAQRGSPALRQAALYNSANLHLREAMRLREQGAANPSLPLLELAKQGYRDTLRLNPYHWDARYNLERALRLAPEAAENEAEALPPPPPRERAITTMQGFTLGLP